MHGFTENLMQQKPKNMGTGGCSRRKERRIFFNLGEILYRGQVLFLHIPKTLESEFGNSVSIVVKTTKALVANDWCFGFRLDVKGCKQNLTSHPARNRSSSNAFQLAPYSSAASRGILERRTSTTPASALKIGRSVSRESIRSIHHCTCPCLNAPVSYLKVHFARDYLLQLALLSSTNLFTTLYSQRPCKKCHIEIVDSK